MMRCLLALVLIATLHALPAHAQDGTRVHYGDRMRGEISSAVSEEIWTVGGQEGDLILVDVQADSSYDLDTYVSLLDIGGSTLASDDDSGEGLNSRLGPFRLPQTGDYRISVSSYSGGGSYTLQVVNLNTVPTLVPGKPLIGTLSMEHQRDFFLLAPAQAPHTLWRLALMDGHAAGEESVISLFDSEGFVTSTEYLPSVLDPVVPLPGETYLAVVSWNPASSGGRYELSLENSAVVLLEDGTQERGSLSAEQSIRQYFFRVEAGERVRITVSALSDGYSPRVQVITTDRSRTLFSNEGPGVQEVSATLLIEDADVYLIEVGASYDAGGSGEYQVAFEVVE